MVQIEECGSCRLLGRTVPWAFLIVAAVLSRLPLSSGWQRGAAYIAVIAIILLAGSWLLARITPSRPRY